MEKVNINRANWWKLQDIIHIGPKRAFKIRTHVRENGKFRDIYELSKILGLGRKRMDDIIKQGIVEV